MLKKIINLSSDKWLTILIVAIVVAPICIASQSIVPSSVSEIISISFQHTMCAAPVIIVIASMAIWAQYRERNKED